MTNDERIILKHIPKDYKYIARDANNNLWLYKFKPFKVNKLCIWWEENYGREKISLLNDIFSFIKWEDEEPRLIEKLLKEGE